MTSIQIQVLRDSLAEAADVEAAWEAACEAAGAIAAAPCLGGKSLFASCNKT